MNGTLYGTSQPSLVYAGTTDAQGFATVEIKQSQGVGLSTPLNIVPVNSYIPNTVNYNVIFTTLTSPDAVGAQMWGHMDETITVDALTFARPRLAAEVFSPDGTLTEITKSGRESARPTPPAPVKVAVAPICSHAVLSLARSMMPITVTVYRQYTAGQRSVSPTGAVRPQIRYRIITP